MTRTRDDSPPAGTPAAEGPPPASASPEAKDRYWIEQVYRGDHTPQLTVRAVLTGSFLGVFLALSNLYTTLKLGWSFGVVVTAVVLSYSFWSLLRLLTGGRLTPLSILENNCMASTASAAGYSTGSTVGVACGALLLLQGQHLPWPTLAAYVFFSAAIGVFLAIPMKRQMVNWEQLPFPTGTAAAETLRSLYGAGREALQKAYGLLIALLAGAGIGVLRTYGTLVEELGKAGRGVPWLEGLSKRLAIPETLPFVGVLNPLSRGHLAGLAFEPSVLLLGAGMLVGTRVAFSMLGGAVLLYYVIAPWMLGVDAASAGSPGYLPAFRVSPAGDFNPIRWATWGGTSLMVFASLTVLALDWRTIGRAFHAFRRGRAETDSDPRRATRTAVTAAATLARVEVPTRWLLWGLIPSGLGMILVLWISFHVSPVLGLFAVLLTAVLSLVASRATGETDTTPIGPMGKVTQLLFAILPGAAGQPVINLMTAGATASAGMSAADLLTDLKSGYLLGANPRKQFLAQFFGVFIGTLAVVPGWYLMVPDKARLEAFNPPAATIWKNVAEVLTSGTQMLPASAVRLIVIGAVIGVLLPLLERRFPRARPYLPSPMGLGFSWVMVFQNSLAFALGAGLVWLWTRLRPRQADTFAVPVASGFIAGESLAAAAIAIACTLAGYLAVR